MANITKIVTHPYYPVDVEISGYIANLYSVPTLLAIFACGCTAILSITHLLITKVRKDIPRSELLTALWFVLCGFIHFFFEGYFAYNFRAMGGLQDIFGQLWKEYSLSDSRYLTLDPFVLCMETVTAVFWGPLSFAVAYMTVSDHPLRHPFQIVVSLGQLYGDVLYYATSLFDLFLTGVSYCRPESYYFWCYYFLMNFFWIIIPFSLLVQSIRASSKAFTALSKSNEALKTRVVEKKQH